MGKSTQPVRKLLPIRDWRRPDGRVRLKKTQRPPVRNRHLGTRASKDDQEVSLQEEAGAGATGAGEIIVNQASLIRAEHALTRPADDLGCARGDEAERRNGAVTCPRE